MDAARRFQTGLLGRLGKFALLQRGRPDPYDETLVGQTLSVVTACLLSNKGTIPAWIFLAVVIVASIASGMCLGARFGGAGSLRASLRGITAGVIEAALYAAIDDTYNRHQAIRLAASLAYINGLLSYIAASVTATILDFATVTEIEWQRGAPFRKKLAKGHAFADMLIRDLLLNRTLDERSTLYLIMVKSIRRVAPVIGVMILVWLAYGIQPFDFLKQHLKVTP